MAAMGAGKMLFPVKIGVPKRCPHNCRSQQAQRDPKQYLFQDHPDPLYQLLPLEQHCGSYCHYKAYRHCNPGGYTVICCAHFLEPGCVEDQSVWVILIFPKHPHAIFNRVVVPYKTATQIPALPVAHPKPSSILT